MKSLSAIIDRVAYGKPTNVIDMNTEMKRRKSRRLSLLEMFEKHGALDTRDLQKFGTGVSSRIKELRKEGHIILQEYVRPGLHTYTYLGKKS